jgi:hypothetical protein
LLEVNGRVLIRYEPLLALLSARGDEADFSVGLARASASDTNRLSPSPSEISIQTGSPKNAQHPTSPLSLRIWPPTINRKAVRRRKNDAADGAVRAEAGEWQSV